MEREYDEPIYPEGYQVKAVIYSHDHPDHCFTIEKYSGIHSDEYLECYRVDGQKTGIGTLFKNALTRQYITFLKQSHSLRHWVYNCF